MHKRRLFLLFFAAMSLSIMIMLIVYGLFIKDINFNLDVKNPESAPSPITDEDTKNDSPETPLPPAKVQTPEQVAAAAAAAANTASTPNAVATTQTPPPLKDIVPLDSPINHASSSPPPVPDENTAPQATTDQGDGNDTPTLHYVYLDGFSTENSAEQAIQQLQDRHLAVQPYVRQYKGQIILQFGVYSDKANADALAQQLRKQQVYAKVD